MIKYVNVDEKFVNLILDEFQKVIKENKISNSYKDIVDHIKSPFVDITLIKISDQDQGYIFIYKEETYGKDKYDVVMGYGLVEILRKLFYHIFAIKYLVIDRSTVENEIGYFLDKKILKIYIENNYEDLLKDLIWSIIQSSIFYYALNSKIDKHIKIYKDHENVNTITYVAVEIYALDSDQTNTLQISAGPGIDLDSDKPYEDLYICLKDVLPICWDNTYNLLYTSIETSINEYLAETLNNDIMNGYLFINKLCEKKALMLNDAPREEIIRQSAKSLKY